MIYGQKNVYENNIIIKWPPDRDSLRNLMRALNLRYTERMIIEICRFVYGPKMDQEDKEKFDPGRLVRWF